jgi:hypothetical protein
MKPCFVFVLAAVLMLAAVSAQAQAGDCPNDSKLLNGGPTAVFGEGLGTWWGLVINGLDAAGFATDEEKIAYLNQIFGTSFDTLDELKVYNQNQVEEIFDQNRNGYVCAFEQRGTRAHFDNPFLDLTFFGISDDKISKKLESAAHELRAPALVARENSAAAIRRRSVSRSFLRSIRA